MNIDVEYLMTIFYTCCGFSALAPLICLASYFVRSKILSVAAWIVTIIAVIVSQVLMFTDFGMLSAIVPFLCLFILLAKIAKHSSGGRYLFICIAKSFAGMVVIFVGGKMILEWALPAHLIKPGLSVQIVLILFFNVLLAALLYGLLKQLRKLKFPAQSLSRTVLWTMAIAAPAFLVDIIYVSIWNHVRNQAKLDISFIYVHFSYQNIFLNLVFWSATAMIVHTLYGSKKGASAKPMD